VSVILLFRVLIQEERKIESFGKNNVLDWQPVGELKKTW
jgi:hypothetical protein